MMVMVLIASILLAGSMVGVKIGITAPLGDMDNFGQMFYSDPGPGWTATFQALSADAPGAMEGFVSYTTFGFENTDTNKYGGNMLLMGLGMRRSLGAYRDVGVWPLYASMGLQYGWTNGSYKVYNEDNELTSSVRRESDFIGPYVSFGSNIATSFAVLDLTAKMNFYSFSFDMFALELGIGVAI